MKPLKVCLLLCIVLAAVSARAERFALVKIPVSCLRAEPGHDAEQSSQAIMGTPLAILSESDGWCKVRTPDGYLGYMRDNTLQPLSEREYEAWKQAERVICLAPYARLMAADGSQAGYATYGTVLASAPGSGIPGMAGVLTPSGGKVYVSTADRWVPLDSRREMCRQGGAGEVISTALLMLGAPYLWGGTSSLAPDCSGFTQTAYTAAGLLLPRDTSMQIKCGVEVPSLKEAEAGDLIFYGNSAGRVNHVAIYLGGGKIIHSSGHVRICRMSADVEGGEELYTDTPLCIRRVLGASTGNPAFAAPGVAALYENGIYY